MRIREPRATWMAFLWVWALLFGGIPLVMLPMVARDGGPVPLLLLFPVVAAVVLAGTLRRSLRAGFRLTGDGIEGVHDAEDHLVPWSDVSHVEWRWAEETSGVKVNGRPLPDGYALHAVLHGGRVVRLMQRVAPRYGQQQDCNEQLARAHADGLLPVPFDATIPTHDEGAWSGTPPPPPGSDQHTVWRGGEVPPPGEPAWPTS